MAKPNKYNGIFAPGALIAFRDDIWKEYDGTMLPHRQIVIRKGTPCRIKTINPSAMSVEILAPVNPKITQHTVRTIESRMYILGGALGEALYGRPVQKDK